MLNLDVITCTVVISIILLNRNAEFLTILISEIPIKLIKMETGQSVIPFF